MISHNRQAQRAAWLLYSDLITRLNLLIDECAHLQQTIHNHLPSTDSKVFGLAERPANPEGERDRPWIPEGSRIKDENYPLKSSQQRALRNLYVNVGAIAFAVEENINTIKAAYRDTIQVKPQQAENQTQSDTDHLYWFIALRGHFLGGVSQYYLKHLQHAQEKLIQLIENRPGTLPGPTLMRRWSSGGLGEFLSEYSRQLNGQVQDLLLRHNAVEQHISTEEWHQDQYMAHTWSYNPTSITTRNYISGKSADGTTRRISLTTIWSSYFYLELPVLFPLIYHECAHHFANPRAAFGDDIDPSDLKVSEWFHCAEEAATILQKAAPLEGGSQEFWQDIVSELWADAISIRLGGKGYLFALFLQIFGLSTPSGPPNFSDYDLADDIKIPLNEIGATSRRMIPVDYPAADPGYFWPARAWFALRVYRHIHKNDTNDSWIDGFDLLIQDWLNSGAVAMSARAASHEHQTFWSYKKSLNEWVLNVTWGCLESFVSELSHGPNRERPPRKTRAEQYVVERDVAAVLEQDINSYADAYLKIKLSKPFRFTSENLRLEDICPEVRWWISGTVCDAFASEANNGLGAGTEIDRWIGTYIDHIACDGGVPFRLAMEWLGIRRDLVVCAARSLHQADDASAERKWAGASAMERDLARKLYNAALEDLSAQKVPPVQATPSESARSRRTAATELSRLAFQPLPDTWKGLRAKIDEVRLRFTKIATGFVNDADNIGTFTFGVLRPVHIERAGSYHEAIADIQCYFERAHTRRAALITQGQFGNKDGHWQFWPLLGDYSFATYQPGLASTNKAFHPTFQPPAVLKRRVALRLIRNRHHDPGALGVVRVAQLDLTYRWQWLLLAENADPWTDIYLSSAWEDVILVTSHDRLDELKRSYVAKELRTRRWLDMHSSLGLPKIPQTDEGVRRNLFDDGAEEYVSRWQNYDVGRVTERTGRFDITIRWNAADPLGVWDLLNSIPAEEWGEVLSMVTTFEIGRDGANATEDGFSSHLMMKR